MNYYQKKPNLLRIDVYFDKSEFVIEFTGKVLGKDYAKLISYDTIGQCFDNINNLGFVYIDKEFMMEADVVRCDVAKDIVLDYTEQMSNYVRGHISNFHKFICRKLSNGNLIIEKNVTDKNCQKRLTIYNKEKEMKKKGNRNFVEENQLDNAFEGKCRIEMNLNTKEQIRKSLGISSTRLGDVLTANKNPLQEFLDEVVKENAEQIVVKDKKSYLIGLVLRDCDFDLARVEAKMRELHPKRGTSIKKIMEPYRAALYGQYQDTFSMAIIREQLQ